MAAIFFVLAINANMKLTGLRINRMSRKFEQAEGN